MRLTDEYKLTAYEANNNAKFRNAVLTSYVSRSFTSNGSSLSCSEADYNTARQQFVNVMRKNTKALLVSMTTKSSTIKKTCHLSTI